MPSKKLQERKRGADISRLNPQQQIFVQLLLSDPCFNPTTAAKMAGYKAPSQAAQKLMNNDIVLAAVGKAIHQRKEEIKVDANRVLQELFYVAFLDPGDMFDNDGNLLNLKQMPEKVRRAISSFEVEVESRTGDDGVEVTTTTVKPKVWSKVDALQLVAKHYGMLDERFKVEHEVGIAPELISILLQSMKRPGNVIDSGFIEEKLRAVQRLDKENNIG